MKWLILLPLLLAVQTEAYKGWRKSWKTYKCDPVKCEEHCVEVKDKFGCPKCECEIEEKKCKPIKYCLPECIKKYDPMDGCPFCECKPKCYPPKCGKDCYIEKKPGAFCPECVCKEIKEFKPEYEEEKKCKPIKYCSPGCIKKYDPMDGCPFCECKPKCYPPKCGKDCYIEKKPGAFCPECVCKEIKEEEEEKKCKPFKYCLPGCIKKFDPMDGCPICECKPHCDPPKCDKDCYIEKKPGAICPECVCKEDKESIPDFKDEEKKCEPIKYCPRGCIKKENPFDGCPFCECKPICDPPKCGKGCEIEKDPKGICPTCICKDEIKFIIPEEEEEKKYDYEEYGDKCPAVDCDKPGCIAVEDEEGCKLCKCEPICDPPKCPRRCTIKKIDGKCPECVCYKFGKQG